MGSPTAFLGKYEDIVSTGVGMLLEIGAGFTCSKLGLFKIQHFQVINSFCLKVCFIPLLARALAPKDVRQMNFMPLALATLMVFGMHILLLWILALPIADPFGTYLGIILPGVCVTYIVIGLPIFAALWDESKNAVVSIITLANDLIMTPLYLVLSKIYNIRKENKIRREKGEELQKFSLKTLGSIGLVVISSSIVIGNLTGIFWSLSRLPLCLFLVQLMKYMGDVVLPLCLFCVGGFLAQHSIIACHWLEFIGCMIVRHILSPLLVALFAAAFKCSGELTRQCIVLTCLPSAIMSYLMAENSGVGAGIASTLIFWSTIAHVPMIIAWLAVLDKLELFM